MVVSDEDRSFSKEYVLSEVKNPLCPVKDQSTPPPPQGAQHPLVYTPDPSTSSKLASGAVSVSKGSSIFVSTANVEHQPDAKLAFNFQRLCLVTESISPSSSA